MALKIGVFGPIRAGLESVPKTVVLEAQSDYPPSMKIRVPCHKCYNAKLPLGDNSVQITESGEYDHTCANGHRSRFVIVNPKFQLLFESGLEAIKAGYYREGVVNFAASLERFLEFYVAVLIRDKNPEFDKAELEKVWKSMSNSSERQIGAFSMLFYHWFNQAPPLFDSKLLKLHNLELNAKNNDPIYFRNIVTHQGFYSNYNQAVTYGEAIRLYVSTLFELATQKSDSFFRSMSRAAHEPPFSPRAHPFHEGKTSFKGDELNRLLINTLLNLGPTGTRPFTRSLFEILPLK